MTSCISMQKVQAQTNNNIYFSGKVTYEEKINYRTVMKNFFSGPQLVTQQDMVMQMYDKAYKQFQITNFEMSFDKTQTVFQPAKDQPKEHQEFDHNFIVVPYDDIRQQNITNGTSKAQFTMLSSPINLEDSLPKIKWRITNESRDIAGFHCRRANGVIGDSVYVVAFYTSNIPISAGPENFNGLPGMILGLSIPHAHISWFATAFTPDANFANNQPNFNKKAKWMTKAAYTAKTEELLKSAGSQGDAFKSLFIYYGVY